MAGDGRQGFAGDGGPAIRAESAERQIVGNCDNTVMGLLTSWTAGTGRVPGEVLPVDRRHQDRFLRMEVSSSWYRAVRRCQPQSSPDQWGGVGIGQRPTSPSPHCPRSLDIATGDLTWIAAEQTVVPCAGPAISGRAASTMFLSTCLRRRASGDLFVSERDFSGLAFGVAEARASGTIVIYRRRTRRGRRTARHLTWCMTAASSSLPLSGL